MYSFRAKPRRVQYTQRSNLTFADTISAPNSKIPQIRDCHPELCEGRGKKLFLVEADFEGSVEEAMQVRDLVDHFGCRFAQAVAGFGVIAKQKWVLTAVFLLQGGDIFQRMHRDNPVVTISGVRPWLVGRWRFHRRYGGGSISS